MTSDEIYQLFIDRLYSVRKCRMFGGYIITDHEGFERHYKTLQDAYETYQYTLNLKPMTDAKKPKNFLLTPGEMLEFDNDYSPNKSEMQRLGFSSWKYRKAVAGDKAAIKEFCQFLINQLRYSEDKTLYHQENTIEVTVERDKEVTTKITIISVQLNFLNEEIDISFPTGLKQMLSNYEMIDVESTHTKQKHMRLVLEYYLDHCKITLI